MLLQLELSDGRIRNWGQPPWATADDYPDTTVVDIGDQSAPAGDLRDHRYVNGGFIADPLPPSQEEIDTAADQQAVTLDVALNLLAQIAARRQQIADEMALVGPRATQIASDLALIPGRQTQIANDLTVASNASATTLKQVRDRQLNAENGLLNVVERALNAESVANDILGRALNAEDELYEQVLVPLIKKLRRL